MNKIDIQFDNLDINSSLTFEEYKERIVSLLPQILEKRFTNNYNKQQIDIHHDRINISCPYCGDSMQNSYKKRGNFILSGKYKNYYKCFNCGEFKRIDQFFKEYNSELKLDAINYIVNSLEDFHTYENSKYDMSLLLNIENIDKYSIDRQELINHFKLIEVKNTKIQTWLNNRLQFNYEKFLYQPEKNYLLILNLTPSGKILGVQKRLFFGDNRFRTFKLSNLYEFMGKPLNLEKNQIDYLNTLSMIFNICLVDISKPITLFEGPMDSFLYKNSIANTGANKEIPIDMEFKYFYDSDETGIKRSIEHINKNDKVFLWSKYLRDINAPYRKKWDLNDILIWSKTNNIKLLDFEKYFSNDSLDIIDI